MTRADLRFLLAEESRRRLPVRGVVLFGYAFDNLYSEVLTSEAAVVEKTDVAAIGPLIQRGIATFVWCGMLVIRSDNGFPHPPIFL